MSWRSSFGDREGGDQEGNGKCAEGLVVVVLVLIVDTSFTKKHRKLPGALLAESVPSGGASEDV